MLSRSMLQAKGIRHSTLPLLRRPTSLLITRSLASIPTHFVPGGPEPPSLYPEPPKQRSASAEFYRQIVPSMLHILALSSIVYYALELSWMWLKRDKEGVELREKVEKLEKELEDERKRGTTGGKAAGGKGGNWWKLW
ncbi:hypothetical protein JCM8547_006309 [Rhodosporidiobolus lusitaniae]